jgi:prevent-host-death family protein
MRLTMKDAGAMQKIIGVTELQRHFRAVLDEVIEQQVPYVLTRGSRPEAVIIAYEEFLQYQRLKESDFAARFAETRRRLAEQNAQYSDEEIEADIEAARDEVWAMQHGQQ